MSYGVRFYYLVQEGLLLHPKIKLVTSPDLADIILYLPESAAWEKSECNKPEYAPKLVVLDESDGSHIMERESSSSFPWNLMYFKRSYVRRHNGVCVTIHLPPSATLPPPLPPLLSLSNFLSDLSWLYGICYSKINNLSYDISTW